MLIAVADLAQVLLLGKGAGAIGGALLYTVLAAGLWRTDRRAAWVAAAMPIIPLSVIAGLLGDRLRAAVFDAGMVGVAVVQVSVAVVCILALRDSNG